MASDPFRQNKAEWARCQVATQPLIVDYLRSTSKLLQRISVDLPDAPGRPDRPAFALPGRTCRAVVIAAAADYERLTSRATARPGPGGRRCADRHFRCLLLGRPDPPGTPTGEGRSRYR